MHGHSASKGRAIPTVAPDEHPLSYFLLLSYLLLLFLRPFDLVPALKVLHLPMVTGSLCLATYIWGRFSTGQPVIPVSPMTKSLTALSVWVLITIPFAFWISGSITAFWNDWLKMVILFLLLGNVLQSPRQVQAALWVSIVGAACISSIAIALKVLLGESVAEGRLVSDASGLYSGPNFFSMTLILLLPYVLFFFFLHKKLWVRLFAGFAVIAFTIANMLTESRAGVIGETLVTLLVFWRLRDWGVSLVKTTACVLVGAVLFLPLAPKGLWERFSTLFVSTDVNTLDRNSAAGSALGSKRQREELIVRALILTSENPIFGVGMNNFAAAAHDRFNTGAEDWVGCHDTFLQISSELGIPGLLLYLWLLHAAWSTVRSARNGGLRAEDDSDDASQFWLLSDATVISFLGYVLFSTLAHLGYQPYFFFVAGIGESLRNIFPSMVPRSVVNTGVDVGAFAVR